MFDKLLFFIQYFLAVYSLFLCGVNLVLFGVSIIYYFRQKKRKFVASSLASLPTNELPGVSIIKPVIGSDPFLMENLESFFKLSYPNVELLCCVHTGDDRARQVFSELSKRYPMMPCQLLSENEAYSHMVNPMVRNMMSGFDQASFSYIWVSSSRIRTSDGILENMMHKMEECPSVAMVHQIPLVSSFPGFTNAIEKIYFNCWVAKNYAALNSLGLNCFIGMSYLIRRSALDAIGGFQQFGGYLAEDFYFSTRLHVDTGRGHWQFRLCDTPAIQHHEAAGLSEHRSRLVRWLRLRVNMMTGVTLLFELFTQCTPMAVCACLAVRFLFAWPAVWFLPGFLAAWICMDVALFRLNQQAANAANYGNPKNISKSLSEKTTIIQQALAWPAKELLDVVILIEALWNIRVVIWNNVAYRLTYQGVAHRITS